MEQSFIVINDNGRSKSDIKKNECYLCPIMVDTFICMLHPLNVYTIRGHAVTFSLIINKNLRISEINITSVS